MPGRESTGGRDADLIAAARAAAAWARTRRAAWTDVPLPPIRPSAPVSVALAPPAVTPVSVTLPAAVTMSPALETAARPSPSSRVGPSIGSWVARAAVVAAVAAAGYAALKYGRFNRPARPAAEQTPDRAPAAAPQASAPAPRPAVPAVTVKTFTGSLSVTSTPAAAQVLVDGKPGGVTPVTIDGLSIGRHEITLQSSEGTIRRTVTIAANKTLEIEEAIYSGWVAVYAPFEVTVSDRGRMLRADERNQFMLAPGVHELRIANKTLAYDRIERVEVRPGETTTLRVTPEPSKLTVTSSSAGEVWLDGSLVGQLPLNAAPVPLGTHELVVRNPAGVVRRYTITVGAAPFTLNVEFP